MGKVTKRLALVAMPWSQVDRPSAAVSALASYVREECPGVDVTSFPAYVEVAASIGFEIYDVIAQYAYRLGEPICASLLYPAQQAPLIEYITAEWGRKTTTDRIDWSLVLPGLLRQLEDYIDDLARRLTGFEIVGLTTCFGQLFANLRLAQRIKELDADTHIVIGGSTVSSHVGPSILQEYPFVDSVIQGEGERPLAALLEALPDSAGDLPTDVGVVTQESAAHGKRAVLREVSAMDALPLPDYDAYAALAKMYDIQWALPIEGSRGCWWDRTKRKGNPRATCYFCNLNVQWGGYREKTTGRLVDEVTTLSDRYKNTRIFFVDNIIRIKGVDELASGLIESGSQFDIFYELRANISPFELVRLWEAGLSVTQFGIESLSNSVLKKMGKGTTVIDNLQAMKVCAELKIRNGGNLIINFPGTTEEEVEETRRTIMKYALPYEPLELSSFQLGLDSTVAVLWKEFGLENIRNADDYKAALPGDVWERIRLFELDYDSPPGEVDWRPAVEACNYWRELHRQGGERRLYYRDGGSFMQIFEESVDGTREMVLHGVLRKIYLYCCNVRRWTEITRRFPDVQEGEIATLLERLSEGGVMYRQRDRYLSLAMAPRPIDAAKRIRTARQEDSVKTKAPDRRLPVLT